MTALAIAAVIVAALAFTDRVLQRRAADRLAVDVDSRRAAQIGELEGRVAALEGIADRVQELESREPPAAPDYAVLEAKYDTIITNGINEMRELLAPLRKHILKAVK